MNALTQMWPLLLGLVGVAAAALYDRRCDRLARGRYEATVHLAQLFADRRDT